MKYETVIGLEVHAQLQTQSKLFASPSTAFGADANAQVSTICIALPGVLPVLNEAAPRLAARAGYGLDCTVHARSEWSRKHYFYPDLPKGYQITQFAHPIATEGRLDIEVSGEARQVRINRIHIEEDAGKSVHDLPGATGKSGIDYNRAGVPLIEIVTEPDLRGPKEAVEFMRRLRELLLFFGVCDGNMEEGSLRCDANVSLRPAGSETLGTRCEIKNLNSFRFVEAAIEYEVLRQARLLDAGELVQQQTRLWDTDAGVTKAMRDKSDAHDYRYFPDPDLPPLILGEDALQAIQDELPERPADLRRRYQTEMGLNDDTIHVLLQAPEHAALHTALTQAGIDPTLAANWVVNDLVPQVERNQLVDTAFSTSVAELLKLVASDTISQKVGREVLGKMLESGQSAADIVKAEGLEQVSDQGAIEAAVQKVLEAQPDSVADYQAGKTKVIGFLVGQVMKEMRGKANPKVVNEVLRRMLAP